MVIEDSMTIRDVQQAFSKLFPGLKIEFYKSSHEEHEASRAEDQIEGDKKIGDIRSVSDTQVIIVDPAMAVGELESQFDKQLGLNVQIFRRSNKIWLQTSATDDWSLQEQNRKGLASIQE
ncbi:MAG: hypothetical protein R3275_02710 [Saprospiraceae bacterium]|nr:hypothetical protein [Saprospiraceae bacterium]